MYRCDFSKEASNMKKRHLLTLATSLALLLVFTVQAHALEAFYISKFHIHMQVYEDNSYQIEEVIQVNFSEARHGIIRNIPMRTYRNQPAQISQVQVEGHPFRLEKSGKDMNIKIGSADSYANQEEEYKISYRYTIGADGLKDMDEIYWNLIGLEWDCPIANISFQVDMPKDFPQDRLNFTYGSQGSKANEAVQWRVEGNSIYGQVLTSLGPKEALTIALPLPQGYFTDIPAASIKDRLFQNGLLGMVFSFVTLLLGLFAWVTLGKKRQAFPTVEFYPPQGINSAEAGFLIDGQVDPFDITSLLIYWADKGHLAIEEFEEQKAFRKKRSFRFRKLSPLGPEARAYEHDMFDSIFYMGDGNIVSVSQLANRFYTVASAVKKDLVDSFESDKDTRNFAGSNKACLWLLRLLACLPTLPYTYAIMAYLDNQSDLANLGKGFVLSTLLMILVFANISLYANFKNKAKKGRVKNIFIGAIFLLALAGQYIYVSLILGNLLPAVLTLIMLVLLGILSTRCKKRTDLGLWYEEKLIGFKEFLKATELDRIKMLVDENPHYFYNVLPYALVLGVTDQWAKNFDSIHLEAPGWYQPLDHSSSFQPSIFASNIANSMRSVTDVIHTSPSSASGGSSDGGSSGGGSGGGGGSSW